MGDFFETLQPGERIVVRYRLPDPAAAGARLTDAVGDFLGVDGGTVRVRTRRGDVAVPRTQVTHAKRVPPAPERRRPRSTGSPGDPGGSC